MHKSGKLSVSYSCLDHEYFCPRRLNRTRNICLSDDLILISFFFYAYFSAFFFSCDPLDTGSFCALQPHYTDQHNAAQQKNLDGYVGFASLPNQVYRKSVKRGFEFTLMVVGESGLGKSTLINSLFLTDLYSAEYPGPSHRIKKTVQ
ncbi:hypothetical protein XENOCAPTIV_023769, partial [Xenoophorus captivus]